MNQGFIKIPISIIDSNISKNAILLFGLIQSNSVNTGYAFGSNKYYADKLKCSSRTITNLIKILIINNLIYVENPKSFRRKIYIRNNFLT